MIAPALMCVAMAVYFEARGEPTEGQIAVAHVIHNRIEDPRYPDNACDVVKYITRWKLKGQSLSDLEKAKHCIDLLIEIHNVK